MHISMSYVKILLTGLFKLPVDINTNEVFMQSKLLVLDIDGTVTNSKKEVTPATKAAIVDLMQRGHKCMLASGRPTPGMYEVADTLEFDKYGGYLLSYNGARIMKYDTKEIVYQQLLPLEYIPLLYKFAKDRGICIITYDNHQVIAGNGIDQYIALETKINHLPTIEVDNFAEYVNYGVNKCLMTAPPELAEQYVQELNALYGEYLNIFRSEPFFIEIMPKGVDKAASLAHMLYLMKMSREDCVACGDGFNDITMIKFAGVGVAMANAQPAVKEAADYITYSNDEDGLVHVIDTYFK